jgi:ribosomal protein S18 acetylase RimI-like enzyme
MYSYQKATDLPTPDGLVPLALPLILEAGNPYYGVLFGDAHSAAVNVEAWARRFSSEVSILRFQFLMCDSEVAGGFIALNGWELRKARKADTIALLNAIETKDRPAFVQRLANVSDFFSPVDDDEYYLSKVVLTRQFRGKGLARMLVDRYIEEGVIHGHTRYRLDVHVDNEAAIRCYHAAGFEICHRNESKDGALKYYSMRYARVRA